MLAAFRSRLTFANVVSLVALFVALSGGAYALTIPRNSVGAKQLKKYAVSRSKIRKGAVTSSKVANGSLLAKDFKAGQLPRGERGERGPGGDPNTGADPPKLFGYIRDTANDANPAIVYYGAGVNSVRDVAGANNHVYEVTFNRSLKGCVVFAVPGSGLPSGAPNSEVTSFPTITIAPASDPNPAVAAILFHTTNNLQTDTSFMVAAFC